MQSTSTRQIALFPNVEPGNPRETPAPPTVAARRRPNSTVVLGSVTAVLPGQLPMFDVR